MNKISIIPTLEYRARLSKENLGWVVCKSDESFRPVHRVFLDAENGPVIIIGWAVFEIDSEVDEVYVDEFQAMDAYYKEQP